MKRSACSPCNAWASSARPAASMQSRTCSTTRPTRSGSPRQPGSRRWATGGAPTLRAALERPDRAFPAAIGLGDLEDRDSLGALMRLANHRWRSPILRAAAARALVRLGDPAGVEVIRKLVRSWRIEARQYAVQLVGELELTSLVPDLARAFRRSRKAERPVYETALEQLAPKSPEAKALLASLRQANQSV